MPPRFAYWTILAGGLPTAFRATDRDELLPTFHRIKEKHPDAEMKYFARGKLWDSPEAARQATTDRPARSPQWRPGGEHRDPRQQFKDAKKLRNQDRRQVRWDRKNAPAAAPAVKPHGDKLQPRGVKPERDRRPTEFRGRGTPRFGEKGGGPGREFRPHGSRRFERDQERPPRPPAPQRETPPEREPKPDPPPRPSEPTIKPPGPPERGRPRGRGKPPGRRRQR